jgi:hypothetical protein
MKKSELKEYIKELYSSKDETLNEEFNPADKIMMDVPLFIRLLEYAREDAKTDMDLHNITEKAISLSTEDKVLTMSDYNSIVGGLNEGIAGSPGLSQIADEIYAKMPKEGSYDAFKETQKHIKVYNLSPEEEKQVYAIIRDKENDNLAESAIGEKKLTSAELKKREEIVKSMKDTFKGPKAAMYAIATDKAKRVAEDLDIGHEDDEPAMLKADVYRIMEYAEELYKMLNTFDQISGEVDFPDWWQSKIHIAAENMDKAKHYLEFEMKQSSMDNKVNMSALAEVIAKKLKESAGGTLDFASGKLSKPTPKEGEVYLKDLKPGDKFSTGKLEYVVVNSEKGDRGVGVKYSDGTGNMNFRGDVIVKKK